MTMFVSSKENYTGSTVRTIVIRQSPWADLDPAKHLVQYIQELSQNYHRPDADKRGDGSCPSRTIQYQLNLLCVHLTPRIMKLLIELLHVNLPGSEQGQEQQTGSKKDTIKWHSVVLNQCRIVQHSAYFPMDKEDLTMEDISRFGSILASRVSLLTIQDSPGVLDCLLNAEPHSWKMTCLCLHERKGISAMECSQLGDLLQSSPSIKELNLHSTFIEAPERLSRGLAGATHLQVLSLGDNFGLFRTMKERRHGLATLVVGTRTEQIEGSHSNTSPRITGAVAELLQDPQSQLKRLNLSSLELNDDQFIAISHLLCTRLRHGHEGDREADDSSVGGDGGSGSRLEELNVSFNRLYSRSILEFARLLPSMKFLRKATLGPNPWDECLKASQCKTALLQGLIQSSSVEFLDIFMTKIPLDDDDDGDGLSSSLVHYHVLLNRAGRRILTSIDPVPLGLWSQILERAGTTISYPSPSLTSSFTATTTARTMTTSAGTDSAASRMRMVTEHESRASAVFYLLSNGPILISSH